jgi:hypothetical protein
LSAQRVDIVFLLLAQFVQLLDFAILIPQLLVDQTLQVVVVFAAFGAQLFYLLVFVLEEGANFGVLVEFGQVLVVGLGFAFRSLAGGLVLHGGKKSRALLA